MKNRLSLAHDALRVNDDLINCNQAITLLKLLFFQKLATFKHWNLS